jgi:hypothetical protein
MCTICDLRIDFGVDHPMSLSVAVATRAAIDNGVIAERAGAEPTPWNREAAVGVLRGFRQRLEMVLNRNSMLGLPAFFLLLVETRTWAFFRPTADGFDPDCQREPPRRYDYDDGAPRDAVLLGAESAMQQMLLGKLSFDRALAEGIVEVDAMPNESAALRRAWNSAYPVTGFSRFVCA